MTNRLLFGLFTLGALLIPSLAHGRSPEPHADAPASLSIRIAEPGRITLAALRTDGLPVRHIEASSLLVREGDGLLQPIAAVDAFVDEAQSLSIVFVLDNSSALTGALRTHLRAALPQLTAALQPHDLVRVVSSGASPRATFVEYPAQSDAATNAADAFAYMERLLDAPAAAPGINDAPIYDALGHLRPAEGGSARLIPPRAMVIVISAGHRPSGIGRWNEYDAVAHIQDAQAPIFTFALSSPSTADDAELEFLRHIAAQTHGEFGRSTDEIVRAIDSMRTNYVVRYDTRMPHDGPTHDVEIVSLRDFGPRGHALEDSSPWDRFDDARAVAQITVASPRQEPPPTQPSTTARILSLLRSISSITDEALDRPRWAHVAVASVIAAAIAFLVHWIVRGLRR